MTSDVPRNAIVAAFDAAAETYDSATPVQREVARALVSRAASLLTGPPRSILDLGAGAGHVIGFARTQWPEVELTALDAAPAMLRRLRAKFPGVTTIARDARQLEDLPRYDLILSSMMLHWLDDPRAALIAWRAHLAPGGLLCVAAPVEGSLREWRELTRAAGMEDAVWAFPPQDFAEGLGAEIHLSDFSASYPDARAFLRALKDAGAQKHRPGVKPAPASAMRRILTKANRNFNVTYRIGFIALGDS
ncbi:methyltransferase domain-containing protein [Rhodoblastus acidophilus]|uniref:Methyltransferase domain-containing protein n=1 Tax=Candidatus Rhodoblastus alkanivorans TaxID=2954117 RepID=A0ABS9Z6K5_9HYPH|nr:methyltransferase domain-containing protein [Candidatus Rhodoblastus alkanivorans]MCI4679554.1 methyltransferase domain-containing protein [Candidatus Rhodoblastus alkanivorans]MCI4683305.1 methyltransferase domain-containing protein [Candidatus Rhodoblastus alkanivorans]MDI4640618.1 methyltransferase domain-containing protein [Rhodoblastus acidophilus]